MSCDHRQRDSVVEHQFVYGESQPADYKEGQTRAYEKGRNAGHSQGHQKGRALGKAEGIADASEQAEKVLKFTKVEYEHVGFHKAMLLCFTMGEKPALPLDWLDVNYTPGAEH
jgi:hypothetical protein